MTFARGGWVALVGIFVSASLPPATMRCATIRDDVPDSEYLALGADPAFASVGMFVNSWGYTGAGILIAPDWVLTAAHMLVAASSGTFTLNGTAYPSTQIIGYSGWNESNPLGGNDFGLVHLASSVTAIPPAMLYTGSAEFGQIGTYVGFGLTGTGLTGYGPLDNQKRAFQNAIDGSFGNPAILLGSDFDNPHITADNGFGSAVPLPLEGCVAPGDSGGGVFISDGSQYYLAGVISFVAAFSPWITSAIPEPSTTALLAATGLVMLIAQRWRQIRKRK